MIFRVRLIVKPATLGVAKSFCAESLVYNIAMLAVAVPTLAAFANVVVALELVPKLSVALALDFAKTSISEFAGKVTVSPIM